MSGLVLFVDDDRDDVSLMMLGFREQRLVVETAVVGDGAEALDFLSEAYAAGRPLPAAIVTDLKMPRMDGLELIRRLKGDTRLKDIPVLVLTSSGYNADRAEALRLGASRYLMKPTDLSGYKEIVGELRALMQPGRPAGS